MNPFIQDLFAQIQQLPETALGVISLIGLACLLIGALIGYYWNRSRRMVSARPGENRAGALAASRIEQERLKAIYDLTSTLSATLNYQRVLDKALDLSATAISNSDQHADQLVSAVLHFRDSQLHVASARRLTRPDLRISLPGVAGLLGRVIHDGVPHLARSPSRDPELKGIIALRSCNSIYCLPLRAGLDTYGVLFFAHPDPDFFTEDRREMLDIISKQAIIAIQNARLVQDLEQEKERMVEIQEEARKKLARDLHDGPTQSVAAIAMRVNFARRLMERDAKSATDELLKIEDLARRTTKEIRHMLFTLRPLILESQGLVAALESMAEKMRETYGQNVVVDVEPQVVADLELGKQGVIFYIAEEAINNARKHAQAAHIWVRLKSVEADVVLLTVEDDGVGFNVGEIDATYERRGSLGMVNMRERAELVNGILQIDSSEGDGTRIQVWIPLTEEASDRLRYGK